MIPSAVSQATYIINGGSGETPEEPVTQSGTNIAKGKTVIASSVENDNMKAINAVDGNENTRWASA